jgi:hypothetical protein
MVERSPTGLSTEKRMIISRFLAEWGIQQQL